ncbi:MAG: RNase adapter RapZ [Coriobacteriaceae bacterium]|nr:RNase adapter RapZ [Coriobacteriaceae bacterium]
MAEEETIVQTGEGQPVHAPKEPDLIIISGMSGAGRTEAMHTFEDFGYFCIDNLPPRLLMNLVSLATIPGQEQASRRLAVVCDARNKNFYHELVEELAHVRAAGLKYRIIFLDARDQTIVARYKASRRRHPMCDYGANMTISQGIAAERRLLSEIREHANVIIDTSNLKPMQLREELRSLFSQSNLADGLSVTVFSFGFKHGAPVDADVVIDVRFLPNPFYIPELRTLTGLDAPVRDFVMAQPETTEFLQRWSDLLETIMRGYEKEGKQQLAIGVGCTGGQHRSVALAEKTGEILASLGYNVQVAHRDLALATTVAGD